MSGRLAGGEHAAAAAILPCVNKQIRAHVYSAGHQDHLSPCFMLRI